MKNREEHKKVLTEIAYYVFTYGMKNSGIDFSEIKHSNEIKKEDLNKFTQKAHEGFKIAQKLIIEEIIYYQSEWQIIKAKIKQFRRERNKKFEQEYSLTQKIIEQRIFTLSHIADSIAWQIIEEQLHVGRTLHIGERGIKSLENNNLQHAISAADKINEDPNAFALISDITSFVQIGDLLVRKGELVGVMELKEGKVNRQIEDFFKELKENNQTIDDLDLEKQFDKKTAKQIERFHRQQVRMERAQEIIHTDQGTDPVSGEAIYIITPAIETDYYYDVLLNMQKSLNERNWEYELIEGCLHIGMYKNEATIMAPFIIEKIVKNYTKNYHIIDWMSIVNNFSEPIFFKPFPLNLIFDILVGEVKVIMAIDFDALIELFNVKGLDARWLSNKETSKHKQNKIRDGIIEVNGRGIMIKLNENINFTLYTGTISKIYFDNIYPSSIATSLLMANIRGEK